MPRRWPRWCRRNFVLRGINISSPPSRASPRATTSELERSGLEPPGRSEPPELRARPAGLPRGRRSLRKVTAGPRPWPSATGALRAPLARDDAEPFAVLSSTSALARCAETLGGGAASTARLILVAEARIARGGSVVTLGHDLALVDPDLHADDAEGRLRLGLAVVDVRADRVQRDTSLGVHLAAAHLATAEPAAAVILMP